MRHRVIKHSFGRRPGPRKALMRGLVEALVQNGRIKTTLSKAKELRRHVEKAITKGKKDPVHASRLLAAEYPNKNTVHTIVNDLSQRFKERPGGYTRIIKLGPRHGDASEMAYIEFVDYELPEPKDETTVQGDEAQVQKKRFFERRAAKKKKRYRLIQERSRRTNRR